MELSCEACAGDPQLKALNGCDEPAQEAVWNTGEDGLFYSCPVQFVPETVGRWYEEYAYAKEFGTKVDINDRPERWLLAMNLYVHELNKHHEEKMSKMRLEAQSKRKPNG